MNILIIGLGSIGQRHLRNLKLIEPNSKFYAIRKKNSVPLLNNRNKPIKGNIQRKFSIEYLNSIKQIFKKKINLDCAFICTPSSKHVSETIKLLKYKIPCFVEKPLGSSLKGLKELESLLKKSRLITMMGYQLRFNPLIKYLERVVKIQSPIGKLLAAHIHHGENIEDFHPYEDYKTSYAARKKLGGGVILTQIHEIDYFLHLFSNYRIVNSISLSSKISDLKLNVEDTFSSNFLLKKKDHKMSCSLNLNFFERPKKRKFYLIGSEGTLEACLNSNKIYIFKKKKKIIKKFMFKKNDVFIKELKFFISRVKSNTMIPNNLNLFNGIKTLRFALQMKKNFFKF